MIDADVYQGDTLVAHLERTVGGIKFSYVESAPLNRGFLATKLPLKELETPDLHSFFLNLLPEGARLQLLLESTRSKDDSLGLLLKVGWDTIGDVAVVPHRHSPNRQTALIDPAKMEEMSFWDMFYEGSKDHYDGSVPGVQEKISSATVAFGIRTSNAPSALLKLNPKKYPNLVQNEEFFLRMAKSCGLTVNKARLVYDHYSEPGLLVSRFDRRKKDKKLVKLHQEDSCQFCGAMPAQKYNLSVQQIADGLQKLCTSPVVEMARLLQLCVFSYIIGNSDLHGKNISILWEDAVRLSPAYDLISSLPYPSIDQHMALKMNGKNSNLKAKDFVEFGLRYGVPEKATLQIISMICARALPWVDKLDQIGYEPKTTESMRKSISTRIARLSH